MHAVRTGGVVAGAAALVFAAGLAVAQGASGGEVRPHAGMLRHPDVSRTHIVFCYGNDLWVVPKEGGDALPLASPEGQELYPKFGPDGETIAFLGNYDGASDLYTIGLRGGVPERVTHHPTTEVLCDWTGSGADARLVFQTNAWSGRDRILELWSVPSSGGLPEKMKPPYGANGSVSADGQWLAYTPHTIDTRTWKRYRGGMQTDIWLLNLQTGQSRKITDWQGIDTLPMWNGQVVYYLSDEGASHKLNIWSFDTRSGQKRQVTNFEEWDVKWPSIGPGERGEGEIVFQYGPDLYLLNLGSNVMRRVDVVAPGARPKIREQAVDVSGFIAGWSISPNAKRVAVEARGDVWTAPAKHGSPRNLTRTSGVAERDPSWSPDGKWIAYLSDETGEYEVYVRPSDGKGEAKRLTHDGAAYRYLGPWSPDSKRFVMFEKSGEMKLIDAATGEAAFVDKDPWVSGQPATSWSHDSRWLAYDRGGDESQLESIWLYDTESGEKTRVTGEMFSSSRPVFDRKGEFLYFTSNRSFSPMYGELDTSFIYARTGVLLAAPLRADVKHPLLPKSDEQEIKKDDEKKKDGEDAEKKDGDGGEKKDGENQDAPEDDGVSGTWTGAAKGGQPLPPEGAPVTLVLRIKADGSVTGTFSGGDVSGTIKSGTYDKESGRLTLEVEFPGGILASITGKIEGKSFSGTAQSPIVPGGVALTAERTAALAADDTGGDDDKKADKPAERVEIDLEGFEARAIQLPVKAGNFGRLAVNDKNQLIYARNGHRGSGDPSAIHLFDITDEKSEEKLVAAGAGGFDITADGKNLLVVRGGGGGSTATIMPAAAGGAGEPVVTAGMTAMIDPRAEWRQVFTDAWRLQRDFFYEPTLHGVDWPKIRDQYAAMLDDCASREDVGFVIAEMISELNVGHAYYNPGATSERGPTGGAAGLLGADFELVGVNGSSAYRIKKIRRAAPWDSDSRGPLEMAGLGVKEGDFLLAVNGAPVDTSKDPWAALVGTSGRAVTITVSEEPALNDKARDVVVKPTDSEYGVRFLEWIEAKRKYVEEKTGGRVGYIYVPSTGIDGQNSLVRMFYGQLHKPALIVDERWNSGGQIPTRFIELLNRPRTNYWARRDGKDWAWPPDSHQGPKCMLMNGLSGSGGDAFPAYFKQAGLGKLIGTRTWGGLVGISGNPQLIDGSSVTVPTFGFYETDGTWGIEGHGVDPDIEVIDDPALMLDGADPQLDAAIKLMLDELNNRPYQAPRRPRSPDRSGYGIEEADK